MCDSEAAMHACVTVHILTSSVIRGVGKNGWQSGPSEAGIWGMGPEGCWPAGFPSSQWLVTTVTQMCYQTKIRNTKELTE